MQDSDVITCLDIQIQSSDFHEITTSVYGHLKLIQLAVLGPLTSFVSLPQMQLSEVNMKTRRYLAELAGSTRATDVICVSPLRCS